MPYTINFKKEGSLSISHIEDYADLMFTLEVRAAGCLVTSPDEDEMPHKMVMEIKKHNAGVDKTKLMIV